MRLPGKIWCALWNSAWKSLKIGSQKKVQRAVTGRASCILLLDKSHICGISHCPSDKDKRGHTTSHFIGISPRKVDYHRSKGTLTVRYYRSCEECKEGKGATAFTRGQAESATLITGVANLRRLFKESKDLTAN